MAKKKQPVFVPGVTVRPRNEVTTVEQVKEASPAYRELVDRMDRNGPRPDGPLALWQACKEAMATDDFPQLLGTTIGKKVIEYFKGIVPKWPLIAGVDSTNKLGVSIPRVFVGEAADLVQKYEGMVIRRNNFTDNQYSISTNTYASGYAFTREAIINDDTGHLLRIAQKMARAAARSIDKRLSTVILANANAYDGTAFFHTNHGNTVTTAFSLDLVGANLLVTGCQAIKAQKDIDSRDFLGKRPAIAFTSQTLYPKLAAVCGEATVPAPTAGAPTYAHPNPALPYNLRAIEFDHLGDTTDWYIATDPNEGDPAWVVSFLNGDMSPKILQKKTLYEGNGMDAYGNPACDFEYDVLMDFEVNMGDYRSAYGGVVSGGT